MKRAMVVSLRGTSPMASIQRSSFHPNLMLLTPVSFSVAAAAANGKRDNILLDLMDEDAQVPRTLFHPSQESASGGGAVVAYASPSYHVAFGIYDSYNVAVIK